MAKIRLVLYFSRSASKDSSKCTEMTQALEAKVNDRTESEISQYRKKLVPRGEM